MTDQPDWTGLPHAELVEQINRPGDSQYLALNELAWRVSQRPAERTESGFTTAELELALLHLSQYANETDGVLACAQDVRIRELEGRPGFDESRITACMNCVVENQSAGPHRVSI